MKCPSCNSAVADDAAVCPKCDAVLDPSLLDAAPPESDDDAPAARPPPRPAGRPAPRPAAKKVVKRPASGKRPAAKSSTAAKSRMPEAPARQVRKESVDWREQVDESDWKEMNQRDREVFVADKGMDPDDVLKDARGFFAELSAADKMAFFGTAAMLLSTFFPWKETVTDGDVLGLLSAGVVVTLLSLLALVSMVLRVRQSFKVNPLLPWIVQLACTGFGVVWCLVYVKTSWDSTLVRSPIGNFDMWASKPSFGVIFGFMAGVVGGLGTLLGLKDMGR
ncbi:MAG: zinc ribbon domain-containing protein [Myxococcota bacterium]